MIPLVPSKRDAEWQWLWKEVRPFASYQIASLLSILAASALGLVGPLLLKWLIDDVLPGRRWAGVALATCLFFFSYVGRMLLSSLGKLVNAVGVQRLTVRIRTRLLRHVQSLPAAFHDRHPVGDLVQRLERDVTLIGDLGSDVLPSVVRMIVEAILTVTAMIILDWRLSAVVVPLLPLFGYVRHRYRGILRRSSEEVREATGQQSSLLNELLMGAIQIQLLGAEVRLSRRYLRLSLRTMKRHIQQRRQELLFTLFSMSTVGLGTALIIGYGSARVITGSLTVGGLVAFYSYLGSMFTPMSTAVELYARLNRVRASIRRLVALEDEPTAIPDVPDAVPLSASPGHLFCRRVDFSYTKDRPTLRQVAFDATRGERVALVGASGCGKSSLLKLIPRLYDAHAGSIEIDGHDVRALQLRSLRRAISFVPQDPALFQGTVRDNVRHGSLWARPDDMAQAAWTACFAEVVDRLPRGWNTELGPMGAGLSGGERQRLAITRALIQDRPILILDEATAALDAPTEGRLLLRLGASSTNRILIVVSHRLATARWASRVIVLDQGSIIEQGTHASLYRPGTHYFALWQRSETGGANDGTSSAARSVDGLVLPA